MTEITGGTARGPVGSVHARRRALNQLVREYPETYRTEYERVRPHVNSRYTARQLARAEVARTEFVRFDELLVIMEAEVTAEMGEVMTDDEMNDARERLNRWATSENRSEK